MKINQRELIGKGNRITGWILTCIGTLITLAGIYLLLVTIIDATAPDYAKEPFPPLLFPFLTIILLLPGIAFLYFGIRDIRGEKK